MYRMMSDDGDNNEEQSLVDQIHDEIRKIRQCKTMLDNNEDRIDVDNPIDKALIENNSFRIIFDDKKLTGCSVIKLNPVEDLHRDLEKELEYINHDLANLMDKILDLKEVSGRMERNSENLKLMLEANKNSQVNSRNLDLMEKNIKQRFMKEKRELKTVITTLFPDNLEIRDLIAEITEHYFTEGADKYLKLENSDNLAEQIEFLTRTEMFEVNPYNPMEIKLADII